MKKVWGVAFIIVGLVIALTPFTPGSILLVIGIDMVFGNRWPWWKRTKSKLLRFLRHN